MKDTYNCNRCQVEWAFIPEDYGSVADYPETCPLCSMPITQMIGDVYREEGLLEVLKMLWVRITTPYKGI